MTANETVSLLDQVRGVLFGMANTGDEFLSPISSVAIHHALAARGRKTSVSELMEQLLRLRDVQDLPSGYWLPVSTRVVILGNCALLVSGKPTSHLIKDHGITPFGAGYGRLVSREFVDSLPVESLTRWLDAPSSTGRWADEYIGSAAWVDPIGSENLILFDHWSKRPSKRWIEEQGTPIPDGPVVGKQKFSTGQADHYLLRFRRGRAEKLFQISTGDTSHRLRIALQARAGNPRSWTLTPLDDETATLTSYYLPDDEMRLLDAAASVNRSEDGITARLPVGAIDGVREMLMNLGLRETERAHG